MVGVAGGDVAAGEIDGEIVGFVVGKLVGKLVGTLVGKLVGRAVGVLVGTSAVLVDSFGSFFLWKCRDSFLPFSLS